MTKDTNSGNSNSGNWNSGNSNSGNWNSGNSNSGYWNSGNWNSGNSNSGNSNSGNRNSGYWNSGNSNSGMFNTDEPNMRMFNKDTDIKRSDFNGFPLMEYFNVSYWISEDKMTEEEKKKNPTHKTTGGYTKKVEYKEAWEIFWRRTPEENKQKFLDLPNFDAEIFKEITGIDVNESNMIDIDGKKWSKDTIKEALKHHVS